MTFKKEFKKSFSYTWYLYLLAIVLPCVIFPLSYSFMHRAKQYETLSIFIPCETKLENAEELLLNKFRDKGVKKTEFITSDSQSEYDFAKKLSVIGYNRCDLIIIPGDIVEKVGIQTAALELSSEVQNLCKIDNEKIYIVDSTSYGVELSKSSPLNELCSFDIEKNYYAFLNANSYNVGEYSNKTPNTKNAFELLKYCLGKYE